MLLLSIHYTTKDFKGYKSILQLTTTQVPILLFIMPQFFFKKTDIQTITWIGTPREKNSLSLNFHERRLNILIRISDSHKEFKVKLIFMSVLPTISIKSTLRAVISTFVWEIQ